MTNHIYLDKIKSGSKITKEIKEDYIKTLTFNSNKIILNSKNFDENQFLHDFNIISSDSNKLYVYLDLQDSKSSNSSKDNVDKLFHEQSIKNIDSIFGDNRIILNSSRMFEISVKNGEKNEPINFCKAYLIYSECNEVEQTERYKDNQRLTRDKIEKVSNITLWSFKNLITYINQMQLYKCLYIGLFAKNSQHRISNFTEVSGNKQIFNVGIIRKEVTGSKTFGRPHYLMDSFKIEKIYNKSRAVKDPICFKFSIETTKPVIKEAAPVFSQLCTFADTTVQMAILGKVDSIKNFNAKKSITFNIKEFDNSRFNLYCMGVDILKSNPHTSVLTARLKETHPILENESFYENNIKMNLTIGLVYESHLNSYVHEFKKCMIDILEKKASWIKTKNIQIKPIEIAQNLEITKTVDLLKSHGCDGFICLTDIEDYMDNESGGSGKHDYYKEIKNYSLKQNLENKEPLITQGLIIGDGYKGDEDDGDEVNVGAKPQKGKLKKKIEEKIEEKIKVSFCELCTKYIFYNNIIHLRSTVGSGQYCVMSFSSEKKLASIVEIITNNQTVTIVNKDLFEINSKNFQELLENTDFIEWLTKKNKVPEDVSKQLSSYKDFMIYDIRENNFLLCSSENTYLLSDNEFAQRKELILKHKAGRINNGKESVYIMASLMPLYNIPQASDRQIHVFDMDNESFYFVGNDLSKKSEHMQTQLVKMYFSENSNTLSDIFFKLMTCNVVRNGLNAKTTLLEKFSKIPMIN